MEQVTQNLGSKNPHLAERLSVMVIDDDPIVLKCFEKMLDQCSIHHPETEKSLIDSILGVEKQKNAMNSEFKIEKLQLAESGLEALKIATSILEKKEPLHIAFCDIRMPELDGIETAKRLLEQIPDLQIAFVTGYYDIGEAELKKCLGKEIKIIHKPFRKQDLLNYIEHVVDGC